MALTTAAAAFCLLGTTAGQQVGPAMKEEHPSLTVYTCEATEACMPQRGGVTLDAQHRWLHSADDGDAKSCMSKGVWDKSICPDAKTCAENCAIEGFSVDSYNSTFGISRVDNGFKLEFSTSGGGSHVHLTDALGSYRLFRLKNREISFDVDLSNLPCGVSSGITLTPMDSEGEKGMGNNMAGAAYGLGRCDATCTRSVKFIRGQANLDDWDAPSGTGKHGSCCPELRLWEANQESTSMSVHACASAEPEKCEGSDCDQKCDATGCSFDPAALGSKDFFGPGATVDTEKPITVVTQFITEDSTDTGALSEVRRYYVQGGKTISNVRVSAGGGNSITNEFCGAQKKQGGSGAAASEGYVGRLSAVLDGGVVLSASILETETSKTCAGGGPPKRSSVIFSNFMHGEIAATCPECFGDEDQDTGNRKLVGEARQSDASRASTAPRKAAPTPFIQSPMFKYIMGGVGLVLVVVLLSTCTSQKSSGWTVTGQSPVRGGSSRRLQ